MVCLPQEDVSDVGLRNKFLVSRKLYKVFFDNNSSLKWELDSDPTNFTEVPLENILVADYCHFNNNSCCYRETIRYIDGERQSYFGEEEKEIPKHTSFTIHYVTKESNSKWTNRSVVMGESDVETVASWVTSINNALKGFERPKKLLLFINPYGGRKKGPKIYKNIVQRMFETARVKTDVFVTQRPNHIKEIMEKSFLDDYNGVVCIGGDGTFSEMINSLITYTARKSVNEINRNTILPVPSLRVGFIPAGSTNTVAYTLYGTADVTTSVIFVILGDYVGLDVSSVHSKSKCISYFVSLLSYGYLGDVIQDSEKYRWMGPKRYDFSGFKRFMKNQGYEGEIGVTKNSLLRTPGSKCLINCGSCSSQNEELSFKLTDNWEFIRGKYLMVIAANIPCSCARSPNGISPSCHIGDGCMDIILVKHTSLINNLRLLLTLSSRHKRVYDLPFVEVYRTKEFMFQSVSLDGSCATKLSVWNCDGELFRDTSVRVKTHCQLLKIFFRH